jgi:hypothetical protein
MADAPKDDDKEFEETVKRLLATPPKPHKPKPPKAKNKKSSKAAAGLPSRD